MTEISPLRRRMTEDITVRNLSPATQRSYISAVSKFSRFFGRSPDKLTLEDVRTFQVHLVAKGMSWPGLSGNFIKNPGNPRKIRVSGGETDLEVCMFLAFARVRVCPLNH